MTLARAGTVKFHCAGHLDPIAILRCQEIGAHEQKDDVSLFELRSDPGVELVASDKAPVVPGRDDALAL